MGADQSRPADDGPSTPASRAAGGSEDFYTLLEVDDGAGELEIKKSFRKLALKWHPDKNPHRLQESTLYFSRLQEAYETLSDPQERAYYDRRRQQASLRTEGPDVSTQDFDDVLAGRKAYGRPVKKTKGLGVRELERFFDKGIWRKGGMSDANGGFYQIYATLFAHLSQEESLHADVPQPPYPVFGDSNTPWSLPDRTIIQVRNFYNVWSGFATEKSFEWVEQWDAERGDVRYVRRMMEKDNKKARDDAKREYNETVRTLVAYLRKRDPRVPKATPTAAFPFISRPTTSGSRTPSSATGTPPAGPPPPTFTPQEWQRATSASQVYSDSDDESASDASDAEGDATLRASKASGEWECIVCGKSGKSEGRWRDHERSKGHRRELYRVKKEMLEEDWELGLGGEVVEEEEEDQDQDESDEEDQDLVDGLQAALLDDYDDDSDPAPPPPPPKPLSKAKPSSTPSQLSSDEEDELNPKTNVPGAAKKARKKKQREEREARQRELEAATAGSNGAAATSTPTVEDDGEDKEPVVEVEMSKKDKRRERERKKAEAAANGTAVPAPSTGAGDPEKCNICRQGFASRTKLFDHIKATGHASLKTVGFAGKSAPPGGKSGDWSSEDEGRGKKGKKKGKR